MNKIQNIFTIPIYVGEVNDKETLNASLLNSTFIKEDKLGTYNNFHGNFTNSFGTIENLNEDWVDNLLSEIMLGLKQYIEDITQKEKPPPNNIELKTIWFNSYKKGQYQEAHDHLEFGASSPFSFIYYLKLPEDSPGKTVFLNEGYGKYKFFYSDNLNIVPHSIIPNVKEGQYIIFPSFLTHYVSHHSSENEKRITVAGNIDLNYKEEHE